MPALHVHRSSWLRHRQLGDRTSNQKFQLSTDSMSRLQLESQLEGHAGCVNCLEWNASGRLLASGSDDHNVIIWDPFKRDKKSVLNTGHRGPIFSVKFMPNSSDNLVATGAGDNEIRLMNVVSNQVIWNCSTCHEDRVKRLATHPNQPNLLWSASEDGKILQHDIREEHRCRKCSSSSENLLINLKTASKFPSTLIAKCLAINPMRDEMLAVGANDFYTRLFDRRFLRQQAWNSCTAYFRPGHLKDDSKSRSSYGTTYLAFSPNGSELLVNIHAEQVYLFDTYRPCERYKSFQHTVKPLILDMEPDNEECEITSSATIKPHSEWEELRKLRKFIDLPDKYKGIYETVKRKLENKVKVTLSEFDEMNQSLLETKDCVELYQIRGASLIQRGWKGDFYQAMRDSCCAIAIHPLDHRSYENLALAILYSGDKDRRRDVLDLIKIMREELSQLLPDFNCTAEFLLETLKESSVNYLDSLDQTGHFDGSESRASDDFRIQLVSDLTSTLKSHQMNLFHQQQHLEPRRCSQAFDYNKRFCGHCNMNTDIKEANFFGQDGEFVVAGSDDGAFYIWDKQTTNIVKAAHGDLQILNCLQPHPSICLLATSGIESTVKLWSPVGKTCRDVSLLDVRCLQNQNYIKSDPLEAMIMMLYPNRDDLN